MEELLLLLLRVQDRMLRLAEGTDEPELTHALGEHAEEPEEDERVLMSAFRSR